MNRPIQTTKGRFGFTDLPNELLLDTFLRLDLKSLLAVCQSNQQMRSFCQDDFLWKQKFIQDFGPAPVLQEGEKWKEIYKAVFLERPDSPISVGDMHYGVIDNNGLLYMAGRNSHFQRGFGPRNNSVKIPALVQVGPIGTKVISISCSERSTVVVTDNGQVYGAGKVDLNLNGRLRTARTFQKMNVSEKVQKAAHSNHHYLFLLRNGSVRVSGVFKINSSIKENGVFKMIGHGAYQNVYRNTHFSGLIDDIKAIDIAVISGEIFIRTGGASFKGYPVARYAIIDVNHKFYYFGTWFGAIELDIEDELVIYLENRRLDVPMFSPQKGLTYEEDDRYKITIQPVHIMLPESVKQVALGLNHILILTSFGNVYVMGVNSDGQLGIGNGNEIIPLEIPRKLVLPIKISFVSTGKYTSMAITINGQLYMWGSNKGIISNSDSLLESIPHEKYPNGFSILKPIRISLDVPGHSREDEVNTDKHKVVYVSIETNYGIAVTKDGYLNFFHV